MFQQITILGPGLLGASLGMAVKQRGLAATVVAWARRTESRIQCLNQHWCDAAPAAATDAVAGSDLVILCTPVETILPLLHDIRPALSNGTLVTDVGSTKGLICRAADHILEGHGASFLGAHPMAGSEQAGIEHADAKLFENATCILTPVADTSPAVIAPIKGFWESLGMRIATVSPEQHDEIVAHISHLPHLLASTLCAYLATQDDAWCSLAGGGLCDSTRIASGNPLLWKQILEQNRTEVLRAIDGFEQQLQQFKTALLTHDSPGLVASLARGKTYRDQLRSNRAPH